MPQNLASAGLRISAACFHNAPEVRPVHKQLIRTHRISTGPTAWFRTRLKFKRRFTARRAHRWRGRIAITSGKCTFF